MDPEAFLELANQVTKLKMYPYFDVAHCIITCLYLRDDLAGGSHVFSRKHPLACWFSTMLSIFAGSLLANFLLGEPVLAPFKTNNQLLLATAVWYFMFYSPFDVAYKVCKFLPVKLVFAALKEVQRCKKVHDGVMHAAKIYPNGYLIMIIIGAIKGNGSAFLKIFERLMRGIWTPTAIEFMQTSFSTKACIAASVIFVLEKKTDFISAPHALVYFGIVIFFVYFKLSSMLLGIHDPFLPFENLFCALFMGGIWDALSRAISSAKGESSPAKMDASKDGRMDAGRKKD
ncbi:trimeric intracellular cation channel type 1B.1-like [Centruroides sculpturatus]|uniref:trimeric intracellular cation channel type 1B.1-like n=1 Tax=Centruroides sculpturatus TaxID=218467 RepID=UPI000C6ED981|nr:trimeric intracellular cation channel type 1B.1-like [Centruroides sculpturatus]